MMPSDDLSYAKEKTFSHGKKLEWPQETEKGIFQLLDAATLACISVDGQRRITGWNGGAEQLLGWSSAEALDQPLDERVAISAVWREEEILNGKEAELPAKTGDLVELKIWSTNLSGEVDGSVLLATDIGEKKFLERALLEAVEREQRRIGQELHDHLCQHLLGAAFAAKALAGALDRESSPHASELHDLARLINDSVSQARDISRGLHPVELDAAGLMSALHELAIRVSPTVSCSFQCRQTILIDTPKAALNAYRIAQDAVANAIQNTGADKIQINLTMEDSSVCLEVKDNGRKESELTANKEGTIARTLQYRAQAMNAQLYIDFDPSRGTRTTCLFPTSHE